MPYCERCDRGFPHWGALRRHERDSSQHNICNQCGLDFSTWTGLKEHWVQSSVHPYCQVCDRHFDDDGELFDHYETNHWYCRKCQRFFANEYGLSEHRRQSPNHHYCADCKRDFNSANNLRAHRQSSVHQPRNVMCPFKGCGQGFVSNSALVLHLENGGCPSGVDRATVNRVVRQYDRNNVITDPSRLIAGARGLEQTTKYSASEAAWNGRAYECYLCHKGYRSLNALNQHLASPAHQEKVYRCPLSTCRISFTTLSALCQHIESQRCGVSKFRQVQRAIDGVFGGMRLLTVN
ncbi:proteophosphoglycan 5 [Moniliophthora roreri MCA 2997]|uniref:Proteophosphoglycan 5 n=1 Tax=Moniliophthora roreri (strain MCA 2997) TaxID=1381753 RepID=V2WY28_MONRO|nr:proteophosphoglycan 5 [Moniliophthora roreri MCA 2997]